MRRFPWWLLLVLVALLLGLGIGLGYAWIISPVNLTSSSPNLLRNDFKDQFRSVIAASYAATGNLARAQARLSLLSDDDAVEALNAQAQRVTASGEFNQADQLAALALALENGGGAQPPFVIPPTLTVAEVEAEPSITLLPSPEDLSFAATETPQVISTQIVETGPPASTSTPRPTRTQLPTQGAPFRLIGQDTVCDPNLQEGLLQILVFNSNRRQLAGIKIIITWDSGGEEFFTGLKPELGNGYADFLMFPDTSHAVQLAVGSEIATNLVPPDCETPGVDSYLGGYRLTFQQP